MSMDWIPVIVALVAAFLGGGGVFLWKAQSHKTEAEAGKAEADSAAVIAATALSIAKHWEEQSLRMEIRVAKIEAENCSLHEQVAALSKRVTDLETEKQRLGERVIALDKRVADLGAENQRLRDGIQQLQTQVVELGGRPVWVVSDVDKEAAK